MTIQEDLPLENDLLVRYTELEPDLLIFSFDMLIFG